MYLKLGTIGIKYVTDVDDFMILSEVVNSGMSYATPVLVRTAAELDMWFGKDFTSRDYCTELLKQGITLYLYKPISTLKIVNSSYVDIDSYTKANDPEQPESSDNRLYQSQDSLPYPINDNPEGLDKYKSYSVNASAWYIWTGSMWRLYNENIDGSLNDYTYQNTVNLATDLPEIPKTGYKYWVGGIDTGSWYIWKDTMWINEDDLDQNLNNTSISLSNRDTLLITEPNFEHIQYCYPEYKDGESNLGVFSNYLAKYNYSTTDSIDFSRIESGYEALALRIKYSEQIFSEQGYIVLPNPSGDGNLLYKTADKEIPSIFYDKHYYDGNATLISSVDSLINNLEKAGWKTVVSESKSEIIIYTGHVLQSTYFYDFPGITIEPSFEDTNNLLSQYVYENLGQGVEMWSKTIGHTTDEYDENPNIQVEIESVYDQSGYYRFTISRYDYTETFEGPVSPIPGEEERLDFTINKNSKLIQCNFLNTRNGIRTGTYTLKRAVVEDYTPEMYIESLTRLFTDQTESIYPDYFFVPDIKKYTTGLENNYNYYRVYEDFLDIAEEYNCQFLIQNMPSQYKIEIVDEFPTNISSSMSGIIYECSGVYKKLNSSGALEETTDREILECAEKGGDFIFNYTGDKNNRLVYFYNTMTVYGVERPGYYTYLNGLLQDNYSMSVKNINYESPVTQAYEDESIETLLEQYKSNYLVDNNHVYYYKKYFNGSDYITTGWMRFIVGKVFRELEKNRWSFLSQRFMGKVQGSIEECLGKIANSFTIVDSVSLSDFTPDLATNTLTLTIDTYVKDLVDNNMSLDITINYNTY